MRAVTALLSAALLTTSCATQVALIPEYKAEIDKWRADRETRLKADNGWLTLVGLFWIEQGVSKIGSDPGSEVPLPTSLPKELGTITLKDAIAEFKPAAGVALKPVTMHDDEKKDYEVISIGSVSFYLIERGGRYGIRVKDTNSPARTNFAGLDWYGTDPSWSVEAKLTPAPHTVVFDTEVGVKQEGDSPGYLEFDRNGQHYKLDAVAEEGELFLVIRDATSGKTTYAASRFLYAALPDKDGRTRLDFNKAYNPPCVFTPYATCPLPPQINRLATPIEAGEKKYKGQA
ncbi:MAG: DUF1684 domain-containing protein [Bryobacteraceae bacterium]